MPADPVVVQTEVEHFPGLSGSSAEPSVTAHPLPDTLASGPRNVEVGPNGWLQAAEKGRPFGRLLKPDEVARQVAFLASAESGLMTGSIIDFDQQVLGAGDAPATPPALG